MRKFIEEKLKLCYTVDNLIFLGFIGEYIISINRRVMNRPLVVEEERINF